MAIGRNDILEEREEVRNTLASLNSCNLTHSFTPETPHSHQKSNPDPFQLFSDILEEREEVRKRKEKSPKIVGKGQGWTSGGNAGAVT
jgi:hypothetical protein